ncbi:MAG: hypothetical protein P1U85_22695, partial [Verrucomicrobiales bacterium]|nr:hypothetical protein [Verrucomicrobiales bacterium]
RSTLEITTRCHLFVAQHDRSKARRGVLVGFGLACRFIEVFFLPHAMDMLASFSSSLPGLVL